MPQVKVAIWNIQNFGIGNPYTRGVASSALSTFIKAFVRSQEIDVLAIMEVTPKAAPSLNMLLETLNLGLLEEPLWAYDWIKSSVRLEDADYPPTNPDQLDWRGGPHSPRREGYALFWRYNTGRFEVRPSNYAMSEGVHPHGHGLPGNIINLITHGLEFDRNDEGIWDQVDGYNPRIEQLYPLQDGRAHNWSILNFPSVGRADPRQPRRTLSRRPAYCVLDLNIAGKVEAERLCPIICYHAPSNKSIANLATRLSGLSRELFVLTDQHNTPRLHNDLVVAGGDYNYNMAEDPYPIGPYEKYVNSYRGNNTGGADCTEMLLPRGTVRTTVQLNSPGRSGRFNGEAITSHYPVDYLFTSIDQLFYRINPIFSRAEGIAFNLISYVFNSIDPEVLGSIGAFLPLLNKAIGDADSVDDHLGPLKPGGKQIYRGMTDWLEFYDSVVRTDFSTSVRSAAEFIHIFISDHLPLVLTLSWGEEQSQQ